MDISATPPSHRTSRTRLAAGGLVERLPLWAVLWCLLSAVLPTRVWANPVVPANPALSSNPAVSANPALSTAELTALVRRSVDSAAQQAQVQHEARMPGTRVETEVGTIDPALRLAPCQVAEPYLPSGTRAWGSIRIGLRCVRGPVAWNVYVPAQIKMHAPVLVATAALPPGHVIGESDIALQEAEITAEPGAAQVDAAAVIGRVLAHGVKPGQALRAQHVRPRQWFAAGESVTLVARGPGFAITSSGTAMGSGLEGQAVRIRVDNGRIVSGVPVGQRRVEVAL